MKFTVSLIDFTDKKTNYKIEQDKINRYVKDITTGKQYYLIMSDFASNTFTYFEESRDDVLLVKS